MLKKNRTLPACWAWPCGTPTSWERFRFQGPGILGSNPPFSRKSWDCPLRLANETRNWMQRVLKTFLTSLRTLEWLDAQEGIRAGAQPVELLKKSGPWNRTAGSNFLQIYRRSSQAIGNIKRLVEGISSLALHKLFVFYVMSWYYCWSCWLLWLRTCWTYSIVANKPWIRQYSCWSYCCSIPFLFSLYFFEV